MTRLTFHPEALAEFEAAVVHYEHEHPGLGARFVASIESALDRIADAPERWPELAPGIRRHLARVFPYAILYADIDGDITILAVMHCHRRPGYWRHRASQD